jgi:pyruvate,water dikinase
MSDTGSVGGKNTSLREMFNALKSKGVGVVDGFATTADAIRHRFPKSFEMRVRVC